MLTPIVHSLPRWAPMGGITVGRHVWVKSFALVPHELVHVRQQAEHPIWFWVSYLLLLPLGWNPWRTRWEAEAYAVDVDYGRLSVSQAAASLSGALYLWPCTYARAYEAIWDYRSTRA